MPPTTLFSLLLHAEKTIVAVNDACARQSLAPALELQSHPINLYGNPAYRFEGFGIVVGVPPELSFWVHYKPNSPEHVVVGQFYMPFDVLKLGKVKRLITAIAV